MDDWKQIENLPYSVSRNGEVRNDRTGRTITPSRLKNGYLMARLWVDYKVYYRLVHRLVAISFVENPFGKSDVNHIDGDKANNNASNLEWVTKSENQLHRYNVLNRRGHNPSVKEANKATSKPVVCIETGEAFLSISSAARAYGKPQSSLSNHLKGKRKDFAGKHWRFLCQIL